MKILISILVYAFSFTAQSYAQFTIPVDFLRECSRKVTIKLNDVTIKGNSRVHTLQSDCEMHFAAFSPEYAGEPDGLVLEPMNLCVEDFFGKEDEELTQKENFDLWFVFGKDLKNKKVTAEGVPRIWPEHLKGQETVTNPYHAFELHPLTKIVKGSEFFDFTKFIYAPKNSKGNFYEGIKESTAETTFRTTSILVSKKQDAVTVEFITDAKIGNFRILNLSIDKSSIKKVSGGHTMTGQVLFTSGKRYKTELISVSNTAFDQSVTKQSNKGRWKVEALVLFSLSPSKILEAAEKDDATPNDDTPVKVKNPIQLIIYGELEREE